MLAVLGLAPAATFTAQASHHLAEQKEAVELMRQLEEVGRDVRYHAGRLNSFGSSLLTSRWTYLHHMEQIKSLMNDGLRPALTRLAELQPHLPEWKHQSIDKMLEAAKALAADTNAAILTKNNAGPAPLAMNAEYRALVNQMYQHAVVLVKTSDAAATYATARMKAAGAGVKTPQT
jgi:hypothetical protein